MLQFTNVSFSYPNHPVFKERSLTILRSEFVAIVGPNGGGKSTFLKLACGLLSPQSGHIQKPVSLAYFPQKNSLVLTAPCCTEDVIVMGFWAQKKKYKQHDIDQIMAIFGLESVRKTPVMHLSGGQLQRALFARMWAQNCMTLLLDEPLSGIDPETSQFIMTKLSVMNKTEGRTIIMVSHDDAQIKQYIPKVLYINHNEWRTRGDLNA